MNRYAKLLQRIHDGERILIDGGTGTEIERRGVPQLDNAWNGGGALSHPDILRSVHEDYLRLGAEIVISNNFATHYHVLKDAGETENFEAYNRRGVELAIEARKNVAKPDALVASGISFWSFIDNHPSLEDLKTATEKQVKTLADAGTELIMLEMMINIDRMLVLLEAAQSTGLPVWVGFSCQLNSDGKVCLRYHEELLRDALAAIKDKNVDHINIMHSDVTVIDACLDVLKENWSGSIGVYAHSGDYVNDKWVFDGTISPTDYCTAAERWMDKGVSVIGGCCGIEPRHIEELAKVMS